jgi:hypothetical protein
MKEKSIETIKDIKPKTIKKFEEIVSKVSYQPEWT